MITLGGIDINKNMYLGGIETSQNVSVSQLTSTGGMVATFVKPLEGGEKLSLGTTTGNNGSIQGMWCQSIIDAVRELQSFGLPVELDYNGDIHQVIIVDTSSLVQFDIREPKSDTKAYTGNIILFKVG